jgi:hypothetical protein
MIKPSRRFAMALVLLPCLTTAMAVGAQTQTYVSEPSVCPRCNLVMEVTSRLGDMDGPGALPGPPSSLTLDRAGRIWMVFPAQIPPMVFASDGAFIQEVGSIGQGPGEFLYPSRVAVADDSVLVYDQSRRVTVVGPDLTPARTLTTVDLEIYDWLVAEWPTRVAVSGRGRTPATVGWPLHMLDMAGASLSTSASFGMGNGMILPTGAARFLHQHLAVSSTEGYWALDRYIDYRLVSWSVENRPQTHL